MVRTYIRKTGPRWSDEDMKQILETVLSGESGVDDALKEHSNISRATLYRYLKKTGGANGEWEVISDKKERTKTIEKVVKENVKVTSPKKEKRPAKSPSRSSTRAKRPKKLAESDSDEEWEKKIFDDDEADYMHKERHKSHLKEERKKKKKQKRKRQPWEASDDEIEEEEEEEEEEDFEKDLPPVKKRKEPKPLPKELQRLKKLKEGVKFK